MWTRFMDMHSGGGTKEKPYQYIYIEAGESEAVTIFYNRFGHNPNRVTCTCCGEDYSIAEDSTLEQATGYERGCDFDNATNEYVERPSTSGYSFYKDYQTLADYIKRPDILVIYADSIKPEERTGEVPEQGYVWRD